MTADIVMIAGRVLMSLIFILAGLMKLAAAVATQEMLAKMGLPFPALAWLIAVIVELGGGLALLLGVATRPTAVLLGAWCIATALVAHSAFADPAMRVHFLKNLVMAGGFAYVALLGAGSYSLDGWRQRQLSRAKVLSSKLQVSSSRFSGRSRKKLPASPAVSGASACRWQDVRQAGPRSARPRCEAFPRRTPAWAGRPAPPRR